MYLNSKAPPRPVPDRVSVTGCPVPRPPAHAMLRSTSRCLSSLKAWSGAVGCCSCSCPTLSTNTSPQTRAWPSVSASARAQRSAPAASALAAASRELRELRASAYACAAPLRTCGTSPARKVALHDQGQGPSGASRGGGLPQARSSSSSAAAAAESAPAVLSGRVSATEPGAGLQRGGSEAGGNGGDSGASGDGGVHAKVRQRHALGGRKDSGGSDLISDSSNGSSNSSSGYTCCCESVYGGQDSGNNGNGAGSGNGSGKAVAVAAAAFSHTANDTTRSPPGINGGSTSTLTSSTTTNTTDFGGHPETGDGSDACSERLDRSSSSSSSSSGSSISSTSIWSVQAAGSAPDAHEAGWRQSRAVPPGRLQIWWTALNQDGACGASRVARYASCLTPAEMAEVAGSKSAEVAAKRTAARALARCVLARAVSAPDDAAAAAVAVADTAASVANRNGRGCSGAADGGGGGGGGGGFGGVVQGRGVTPRVAPRELKFHRNAHGKPLLLRGEGWPPLRHNLTHTNDLAGVAVYHPGGPELTRGSVYAASGAPLPPGAAPRMAYSVGLDVERLDRAPRDPLALARRRLAAAEVRDLEALSGEERSRHFMWLWTLKEAYVKARGTGINAPPGLKGFAIGFQDMPPSRLGRLASPGSLDPGYRLSPTIKTITLQHTVPASTTTASAATPGHRSPAPAITTAITTPQPPGDDAEVAEVALDGPSTAFSFLLFQPTPHHVGALCLASHSLPVAAPQPPPQTHAPVSAAAAAAVTAQPSGSYAGHRLAAPDSTKMANVANLALAGAGRWGLSRGQEPLGLGGLGHLDPRAAGGLELEAAGRAPLPSPSLVLLLPELVEQWWCVPLEWERRLADGEMTILGVSG